MTGERLFLRFAVPCAELRLQRGQILQGQYDELFHLVHGTTEPDRGFLHQCFPNAVDDLYEFARANNLNPWEYESMLRYWQQHAGRSPVQIATVIATEQDAVRIEITGRQEIALNPYRFTLAPEQRVYVHNHWVVMVQTETLSS